MSREKWSHRLEQITTSLRPALSQFKREDPIAFCLHQRSDLLEYIESYVNHKTQKSSLRASQHLTEGDHKYALKALDDCLSCYSQSIFYAPNNSPDLWLAYAKRSFVLQCMGYYKEAIRDIDLALSCGFPKDKSPQLLLDKGECYTVLGDYDKAEAVWVDILGRLDDMQEESTEKDVIRKEVLKLRGQKENSGSCKVEARNDKLPSLKGGENHDFPSSSNCLEVHYTKEKGRYVTAKCDIKIGDVLFVERPFSFVVFQSICSECCEDVVAPIPCISCVDVYYCSEKCREDAWVSYHKFECPFLDLLRETGIAHLAFKILIKAASNFENLKKTIERLKTKEKSHMTNPTVFSRNMYENVYNLQTHITDMETEDLLQYSLTATLLSLYLVGYTSYAAKNDENIQFCGTLLLRHITQLVSNAHAIAAVKLTFRGERIASEEQEQTGSAIYPSASIMNHSCEPSIINIFHKDYLVVRACKDLEKGEEVFNSYRVNCRRMRRSERQEVLRSQYFFDCRCVACCEVYDRYDILNSFKCEKCKGPLVMSSKEEKTLFATGRRPLLNCLNCSGREVLQEEKLFIKSEINKLIKDGEYKLYEQEDVSAALHAFTKAWKSSRRIYYKYHESLSYSANQVAQCLFFLEDYERCFMFLKCCLLSVEGRFGRLSIELAFEAKKFGDVIKFYCGTESGTDSKELEYVRSIGLKYYGISEETFKLLYGADHPILSRIQSSRLDLQLG